MKTIKILVIMLLTGCIGLMAQQSKKVVQMKSVEAAKQVDRVKSALAAAKIDPAKFEFSGQVTATVFLDGKNFDSEEYCLLSVVGGQVRGTSRGMWFEPGKAWIHNHLTYSNVNEGDTIRFRLHDTRAGKWYQFDEYVVFKSDMLVANAIDPFVLKTASLLETAALSLEPSLDVFPNPAGYLATIKYVITTDQQVIIQVIDFTGRVVGELELGKQTAGEHQADWDTKALKQGVYYLRIKDSANVNKQVVITDRKSVV